MDQMIVGKNAVKTQRMKTINNLKAQVESLQLLYDLYKEKEVKERIDYLNKCIEKQYKKRGDE